MEDYFINTPIDKIDSKMVQNFFNRNHKEKAINFIECLKKLEPTHSIFKSNAIKGYEAICRRKLGPMH